MFEVVITPSAESDIQVNYRWWFDHRSKEQAIRWYLLLNESIQTLSNAPDRCPLAPEAEDLAMSVRQLSFGLGRRPSHRVLFVISHQHVIILRVRHASQSDVTDRDLE